MEFTAQALAHILEGEVEGDLNITVNKLSKIEEGVLGSISFLSNELYTEYIYSTKASIVIVNKSFTPEKNIPQETTLIKVADARLAFAKLLEAYQKLTAPKPGIHPSAVVEESAVIGEGCYIGPSCYIGENAKVGKNSFIYANSYVGVDATIGTDTILKPGVKVMENCKVGNDCLLHPGVIIGGDGFGFAPNSENNYQKVVHTGNVIIEDHVEIGSNTSIDKATLGSTIIRRGVKLDNLIQIAHNVEIGENTVIAAQTGIAGSTKIGKNCMIGGQVGIVGHIKIADEVKIAAQSGIGQNIDIVGQIVQGSPAFFIGDYKRSYVLFRKLPEIYSKLNELLKASKK